MDIDKQIRLKAFEWLSEKNNLYDDILPREILETGFIFQNQQIPLVSPQGIFKPKILDIPLSITTAPKSEYNDFFDSDGFLSYKYRGNNPSHRDNVGLRNAMTENLPLVYFFGIVSGKYLAVFPVFIIGDNPDLLTFKVAVDDLSITKSDTLRVSDGEIERRKYITSTVKLRLHQRSFRIRVINAYKSQCALCRLKHSELLDAAHIIPDSEPESTSLINNGISLCKLHHATFDKYIIGINADYKIEVREDVLEEIDGPMLQYGLKELHNKKIILPNNRQNWPNKIYLDWKYQKFKKVG